MYESGFWKLRIFRNIYERARLKSRHKLPEYSWQNACDCCSIGLYAINLIRKVVPEKHIQNTESNHRIRLLTPDRIARIAFGDAIGKPNKAAPSFRMGRSRIYGPEICFLAGVMYRGIIDCYEGAAFDPHVKEVGKK